MTYIEISNPKEIEILKEIESLETVIERDEKVIEKLKLEK